MVRAIGPPMRIGWSIPHRSIEPIDVGEVGHVARRAEELGVDDLWVTNNPLDHDAHCLDSLGVLNFVAGQTERVRLGVSVLVLPVYHPVHVAHSVASLDLLSGGRVTLGVGLGRPDELRQFQVPSGRRVGRFLEQIAVMRALWAGETVTTSSDGDEPWFELEQASMRLRPVQRPHPPLWFGGVHPDAIARAARHAEGWMSAGGASTESFATGLAAIEEALATAGRDRSSFTVSKRLFMAVHDDPDVARAEVRRWYGEVYGSADHAEISGVFGTLDDVRDQIQEIAAMGPDHLLLNPITRHRDHVELDPELISGLSR